MVNTNFCYYLSFSSANESRVPGQKTNQGWNDYKLEQKNYPSQLLWHWLSIANTCVGEERNKRDLVSQDGDFFFFALCFLQFSCVIHSTTLFSVAQYTMSVQWHNNAYWNLRTPWRDKHTQHKLISCTRSYYLVRLIVPSKCYRFSFYTWPLNNMVLNCAGPLILRFFQ